MFGGSIRANTRLTLLLTTVLGNGPIICQAHHHEVGQVATTHVIAIIDCPHDLVIVLKEYRLLTKLNFKCSLCHFQGEPDLGVASQKR